MSYMTLSSQEKHLFYSVRTFPRIRQHYFSKYWGTDAWAVPHLKFWAGTVPLVPLGLRLCFLPLFANYLLVIPPLSSLLSKSLCLTVAGLGAPLSRYM